MNSLDSLSFSENYISYLRLKKGIIFEQPTVIHEQLKKLNLDMEKSVCRNELEGYAYYLENNMDSALVCFGLSSHLSETNILGDISHIDLLIELKRYNEVVAVILKHNAKMDEEVSYWVEYFKEYSDFTLSDQYKEMLKSLRSQ